ncbi:MAG: hypothetical protein A2W09_06500 [Deltaproteobacteria bacterium RBG_16_50_11]|nr:MAG: hypothetical protein A2W09_06500 [Deltaproteobacteria bacterium RBG_16_50_11]
MKGKKEFHRYTGKPDHREKDLATSKFSLTLRLRQAPLFRTGSTARSGSTLSKLRPLGRRADS